MNFLINNPIKQSFNCPYCRTKTTCINIKKKYINQDDICCICLDYILSKKQIIQTKCKHKYHTVCLKKFIIISNNNNNDNNDIDEINENNIYNVYKYIYVIIILTMLILIMVIITIYKYIIKY